MYVSFVVERAVRTPQFLIRRGEFWVFRGDSRFADIYRTLAAGHNKVLIDGVPVEVGHVCFGDTYESVHPDKPIKLEPDELDEFVAALESLCS